MIEFLLMAIFECQQCIEVTDPTPPPDTSECAQPLRFGGGTLWKPEGDNNPNLVVLLAPQHDYEDCEVKLRDNQGWEGMTFTGRSNGDRQTWRASQPGGPTYAGKKQNGGVRCFRGDSTCFFPIPGPPKNRHE